MRLLVPLFSLLFTANLTLGNEELDNEVYKSNYDDDFLATKQPHNLNGAEYTVNNRFEPEQSYAGQLRNQRPLQTHNKGKLVPLLVIKKKRKKAKRRKSKSCPAPPPPQECPPCPKRKKCRKKRSKKKDRKFLGVAKNTSKEARELLTAPHVEKKENPPQMDFVEASPPLGGGPLPQQVIIPQQDIPPSAPQQQQNLPPQLNMPQGILPQQMVAQSIPNISPDPLQLNSPEPSPLPIDAGEKDKNSPIPDEQESPPPQEGLTVPKLTSEEGNEEEISENGNDTQKEIVDDNSSEEGRLPRQRRLKPPI